MTEITRFIAEDGTEFNSEMECAFYETTLKMQEYENDMHFINYDGNTLSFKYYEDAHYIKIDTDEAAEVFGRYLLIKALESPWDYTNEKVARGEWYWDGEGFQAVKKIEEQFDFISEILEQIKNCRLALRKE